MAIFQKVDGFVLAVAEGKHNLSVDQLTIALTNTLPDAADSQLSDLTQIAYTNLSSSRNVDTVSSSETGGVYTLVLEDKLRITATGGSSAPFRYVYIYNSGAINNDLIGMWDYGSALTLLDGQYLDVDFDGVSNRLLTLT